MRKTAMYRVTDEGRDKGKTFLITEMPAEQGEAWAGRVLLGVISSGTQLPEGRERLGMAALAEMGLRGLMGIRWEALQPLLVEMFSTIQFVADPKLPSASTRELIDGDIEEITTRVKLRVEWWKLHMGFLQAVAPSLFEKVKVAAAKFSDTGTSAGS
jgi:hypothetical protein